YQTFDLNDNQAKANPNDWVAPLPTKLDHPKNVMGDVHDEYVDLLCEDKGRIKQFHIEHSIDFEWMHLEVYKCAQEEEPNLGNPKAKSALYMCINNALSWSSKTTSYKKMWMGKENAIKEAFDN
ncbi:hypothetical protein CR513_10115, partial [Mucuna pruriens]